MEKKASGEQEPRRTALTWEAEAPTARKTAAPGSGWVSTVMEARRSLTQEKAACRMGDQGRDLPGPFKALVRGAWMRAAFLRNLL